MTILVISLFPLSSFRRQMTGPHARIPVFHPDKLWVLFVLASLLLLVGCGAGGEEEQQSSPTGALGTGEGTAIVVTAEPEPLLVDLILPEEEVSIESLPLRAGYPFTLTATIYNNVNVPANDVPVMVYISAKQEEIGYTSYLQLFTVTLPASQTVPVTVPVDWNFSGGEHQLWIQVNRLPDAWQDRTPTQPEAEIGDNIVLMDLMVEPFDAYSSDLCSGRVDVQIGPTDVLPEPAMGRVLVRVHNLGNRAVYNLPVVVTGNQMSGIAYTPAIPPCGGTTEVYVEGDRPFHEGERLTVQVNPYEWVGGLEEDDANNNQVTVVAGLLPEVVSLPASSVEDYDFALAPADIEIPEMWMVMVTVQNLGTRDADMVPIRVENAAGREIVDSIPLVQGEGLGVAAMRVGYLWIPGGTLTFTVNPEDAKGAYPETHRGNNVTTFTLP
jgi:hypothetical protein